MAAFIFPSALLMVLLAGAYVAALIQLMWQTHRAYTAAMVVLRLWRAFIPIVP